MKNLILLFITTSLVAQTQRLDPPVGKESGMPHLARATDGTVYLSYIDYLGTEGHALRITQWNGSTWSTPQTIAQGKHWFVNWADYPTIAAQPDGSLLAHWLTRSGPDNKYGYGIRIAKRDPKASTWHQIHGISLEEQKDYAGFLSFLPNTPGAIYLAPPQPADAEGHRKTVRFVSFSPEGKALKDLEVDADACSCCQTTIAPTRNGMIAAYRDHQPGEIRDISIIRFTDGAWAQPKTLHPDNWKINGCPTDGPSLATTGDNAGIVWLTRANEQPKVQIALSADAGAHFSTPIRLDEGNPLGRASLTLLDPQNYLAVWLEKVGTEGQAEIRLRRISLDGKLSPSLVIAKTITSRNTGFPKIAIANKHILVSWRDNSVQVAQLPLSALPAKDPQ
jgi:hypothetical protein